MGHEKVVREKLMERYLLDELQGEARDEFEEHFFECSECALDLQSASQFVVHSKVILADEPAQQKEFVIKRARASWFAWLRPAFAAPALAALLAVVGYQNLVTYPQLRSALRPQVIPWAAVAVGTWGSAGSSITVAPGKGFMLFVRIPPDGAYSSYVADLYNPAGKLESSVPISASGTNDQWPVVVPEGHHDAGNYRITVRGVTSSGQTKDVGSAAFTLQIQQ